MARERFYIEIGHCNVLYEIELPREKYQNDYLLRKKTSLYKFKKEISALSMEFLQHYNLMV